MRYCIDTNIWIFLLSGRHPGLMRKLTEHSRDTIFVPSVVRAELMYGAFKSRDPQRKIDRVEAILRPFQTLYLDDRAAREYGRIRADLESAGEVIGGNDMMIAATSVSNDCILITNNVGEFGRVAGLKIEDWTEES
ncbi:MAG: type II toxin-antitoxin system VapC family toxin [Candidatus Methanoplasma sp.]|jgi:tRNA(fMet)-specific endonuclease VapC|nr:type II toxin-antitoxin system VapC family toxin [Candidatus Methanoplasma sp.]